MRVFIVAALGHAARLFGAPSGASSARGASSAAALSAGQPRPPELALLSSRPARLPGLAETSRSGAAALPVLLNS